MAEAIILAPKNEAARQWRLTGIILAVLIAVLGLGWYMVARSEKAILASGLLPGEAAGLVDELKKENVDFTVKDGGTTVMVPAAQVDTLRVSLSTSQMPTKGTVGFELFNQSDMGLTDFAQKINFQRALQGELARTIMAMDGVASARVHLALPERSLFRSSRSDPRAAVTVAMRPNIVLDADRVAGIQRLVAAAVPDLSLNQIAILNSRGQLVSASMDAGSMPYATALERAYAERVGRALSGALPQLQFDTKVTTVARADGSGPSQGRDHSIRIIIYSRIPLSSEDQQIAKAALDRQLGLSAVSGDEVFFSPYPSSVASTSTSSADAALSASPRVASEAASNGQSPPLFVIIAVLIAMAAAAGLILAKRSREAEREPLVGRIREQLRLMDGAQHVR